MAKNRVSLKDKKRFLKWFIETHQMKKREALWVLNYILNHDIVLNKTKFVENAENTPRGIKLSTIGTEDPAFSFYKDGIEYQDPEKAFHEIRLNWHSDLYLELIFNNAWLSRQYINVIEDNPFAKWNDMVPEELSIKVEDALDYMQLVARKQEIIKEIDQSLIEDKKELFYDLAKELSEIEDYLNKIPSNK